MSFQFLGSVTLVLIVFLSCGSDANEQTEISRYLKNRLCISHPYYQRIFSVIPVKEAGIWK